MLIEKAAAIRLAFGDTHINIETILAKATPAFTMGAVIWRESMTAKSRRRDTQIAHLPLCKILPSFTLLSFLCPSLSASSLSSRTFRLISNKTAQLSALISTCPR